MIMYLDVTTAGQKSLKQNWQARMISKAALLAIQCLPKSVMGLSLGTSIRKNRILAQLVFSCFRSIKYIDSYLTLD